MDFRLKVEKVVIAGKSKDICLASDVTEFCGKLIKFYNDQLESFKNGQIQLQKEKLALQAELDCVKWNFTELLGSRNEEIEKLKKENKILSEKVKELLSKEEALKKQLNLVLDVNDRLVEKERKKEIDKGFFVIFEDLRKKYAEKTK